MIFNVDKYSKYAKIFKKCLSRVVEGSGPLNPGNLLSKVLIPAKCVSF
jgi:hypothetical protein